jgi:hypothetical protein
MNLAVGQKFRLYGKAKKMKLKNGLDSFEK